MPWNDLDNNQTISFTNLKDAVDTGVFSQKFDITPSNEQITKLDAELLINLDTSYSPYASKLNNQLVVKSNLRCGVPVNITTNISWQGIANNQTTSSPIQLIVGFNNNLDGRIFRSTNYGQNYSSVLLISDELLDIKFAPTFRHASYLNIIPFVAVGDGRIVTNSVTDCSSWITISSPTTRFLYALDFNSIGVGIIVGDERILRTNTSYRINSWSIVNSVAATWRDVATDSFNFVAVGDDGSIITSTAAGSTWTLRSMPPLSPSGINLYGVTYHTDGYFYAVGEVYNASTGFISLPYIMRSADSGVNWTVYIPTDHTLFEGPLDSIASINGRLVIGGRNYQYQIIDNVLTRCNASAIGFNIDWNAIVKDANSNGFDMAGATGGINGAYSNF
jgi:hypothetical protein